MVKANSFNELLQMFEKAFEKALNTQVLTCEVLSPNLYKVSTDHSSYEVQCGRTADNQFYVACKCIGSLHEKCCLHGAKAISKHISIKTAEKKIKLDTTSSPYLKDTEQHLESFGKGKPRF